MTLVILL